MHKEILSKYQLDLLPLVQKFKHEFYLVGGTAIALQIGHRRSIDYDLFKKSTINPKKILSKIDSLSYNYKVTYRADEQLNLVMQDVKFTFYQYPFEIEHPLRFEGIPMPDLLVLAALKAYALGRRSKWKDYVDLYFILKDHFSIPEIVEVANKIYDQLFSEKLFRAQLSYFNDIDMSEPVEYVVPEVPVKMIKDYLINIATDIL